MSNDILLIVNKNLFIQISAWLPVVLWMVLIFSLSNGSIPAASSVHWQDFAVKKTGHVLLFGILSLLTYRALRINKVVKKNAAIISILVATLYGATDEYHQLFTTGRESRMRDVFIDAMGAIFVIGILYIIPSKISKKMYTFLESLDLN